jgi:hypothetical protein
MPTKESAQRRDYLDWLPEAGWLSGVASVGDLTGIVPYDGERFDRKTDRLLIYQDRLLLASDFKRAYEAALAELKAEMERRQTKQERLFDPDES